MADTVADDPSGKQAYLDYLKQMVHADSPADLRRYGGIWQSMSNELHDVVHDLGLSLDASVDVFDSPAAAGVLREMLSGAMRDVDDTAYRLGRNSGLVAQAADELESAQSDIDGIKSTGGPDGSGAAQDRVINLDERYYTLAAQLDTFGELNSPRDEVGDTPGADAGGAGSTGVGGPGFARGGGGGSAVPVTSPRGGSLPAGRFGAGPTAGGRTVGAGGKPGAGGGRGSAGTGVGARGGVGAAGGGGAGGAAARVGSPSVRSGMPIGGYRPVAGTPGGGAATPPGGSAPGKPGAPGGPGRPGMAPPPGAGPGKPGRDRPGRRLTRYERADPDTFRDTRHRVKPVIGEQRRQPDEFTPTPGAISGKQIAEETPNTPDLPTADAPMRFEGHDMSVSFNRRLRGSR